MGDLKGNLKVLGFVALLGLGMWVLSGEAYRQVSEYRYLKRWAGYWGQVDSCIGFYAAWSLQQGREVTYERISERCRVLVQDRQFFLGYPDFSWEGSRTMGKDDPLGSL